MKIVHIITGLSTGGAERALYNLLQGGLHTEFDCYVVSLRTKGTIGPQIQALGVPVIALGIPSRRTLVGVINLRHFIKALQPDVIQGWMYHGNLAATLTSNFVSNIPAVLAWNIRHSLYDLGYEKLMTRQVIRANRFFSNTPDVILYNSHLSRKQHEAFGFIAHNGQVIPNGIDVQQFSFSSTSRQRIRIELGIPPDALVFGHVARLHSMKDHPLFLGAAANVALRHSDVYFLLSGRDVSPENPSIAQLIPEKVRNRFHLLGERSDVEELMSTMDVFCLSSRGEGFPNVLGEAMAVGVPCLATDVGDSAAIVGDTGVIVPPNNEEAFIAGIEHFLTMSSEERNLLGTMARARIAANYTLGIIVNQYAGLYEKLVGKKRSSSSCAA